MEDQREIISGPFILKPMKTQNKINILVLGHKGMLGHIVTRTLKANPKLNVETLPHFSYPRDHVDFNRYGNRYRYIINCIGTIKPRIDEKDDASVLNAIYTNSILPFQLALQNNDALIINAATDCIYDGSASFYNENSKVSANDIYGRSKSLGEPKGENVINLRASIIGFEKGGNKRSLVEWFDNLPKNAEINGWIQSRWNGITTLAWARIVNGIINKASTIGISSGTRHIIPYDTVSKYELLKIFQEASGRNDINITPVEGECVDRTLSTINPSINEEYWKLAEYNIIPTIKELVEEMYSKKLTYVTT